MSYYKIVQDNTIIGVGMMWLKWNSRNSMYFYCGMEDAEIVQDIFTNIFYHADWLKTPHSPYSVDEADVILIEPAEYDELYETLSGGEEIPLPDESEPQPEPEPDPEPGTERPMTVQEMREKIAELEETLDIIMGVIE